MKQFAALLILVGSLSASALDYTVRVEARDTSGASSICNATTGCSTAAVVNFGAGVTTTAYAFTPEWGLYSGALLRQRGVSVSLTGFPTAVGTWTYLDIPVEAQYTFGSLAVRAGVDLGLKVSNSNSGFTSYSTYYSDTSLVVPVEIGFDWKFLPSQLLAISYETGVTTANGQQGLNSLATANVIALAYGYTF